MWLTFYSVDCMEPGLSECSGQMLLYIATGQDCMEPGFSECSGQMLLPILQATGRARALEDRWYYIQ